MDGLVASALLTSVGRAKKNTKMLLNDDSGDDSLKAGWLNGFPFIHRDRFRVQGLGFRVVHWGVGGVPREQKMLKGHLERLR